VTESHKFSTLSVYSASESVRWPAVSGGSVSDSVVPPPAPPVCHRSRCFHRRALFDRRRLVFGPLVLVGGLFGTGMLIAAPVASAAILAYGTTPLLAVAATVNPNGSVTITVSGGGFSAGTLVRVTLNGGSTVLGTAIADANGNFSIEVALPPGLAAGDYTVLATGGGITESHVIVLAKATAGTTPGAGSTSTGPTSSGGGLAFTGADETATVIVGAAAIAGGGVFVLSSRRRKSRVR
jgi:hypothetical protein